MTVSRLLTRCRLHWKPLPDDPNKVALLYGPLVLAGERGTEGMQAPAPFSNPALYNDYYTYNFHVPADLRTSLKVDMKHPERTLQRTGKRTEIYNRTRRCDSSAL